MKNKILDAREKRKITIEKLAQNGAFLVCLKANTPGLNKTRFSSYLLLRIFHPILMEKWVVNHVHFYESADGPYLIYGLKYKDVNALKQAAIKIEESHFLGRLIDLDVYEKGELITRDSLHLPARTCMICGDYVHRCQRSQKHSLTEILTHIDDQLLIYNKAKLHEWIEFSVLSELNLHPKFGLVTPFSAGSHMDMNYQLMRESLYVLIPFFVDMFALAYRNPNSEDLFKQAQQIGILAEKAMYRKTRGINTYKGLIYVLGFVCLAYGLLLQSQQPFSMIFKHIETLAKDVLDDFNKDLQTAGGTAFKKYQIKGIRGEVFEGLPTLQKALTRFPNFNSQNTSNLHEILLFFMTHSKDTVALKRAGSYEVYQDFINLAKTIDPNDTDALHNFTQKCVRYGISFGGSADQLIVFHVLKYLEQFYHHPIIKKSLSIKE
ncbi:MAG: triphosphoribosyl-dephospho-CoA synthase [Acholeplasmataceae bacterium]|nr:triphosphoribosyl-dephospho-CoA synthase [Acholeplasmataceae bacterium]